MDRPRFTVHCAEWHFPTSAVTVYDGFTPLDTFADEEMARAYADYLNRRDREGHIPARKAA